MAINERKSWTDGVRNWNFHASAGKFIAKLGSVQSWVSLNCAPLLICAFPESRTQELLSHYNPIKGESSPARKKLCAHFIMGQTRAINRRKMDCPRDENSANWTLANLINRSRISIAVIYDFSRLSSRRWLCAKTFSYCLWITHATRHRARD